MNFTLHTDTQNIKSRHTDTQSILMIKNYAYIDTQSNKNTIHIMKKKDATHKKISCHPYRINEKCKKGTKIMMKICDIDRKM